MKNRLFLIVAFTGLAINAMENMENDDHIISYTSPLDNHHMDFLFSSLTKYYENALIFPESCLDKEGERLIIKDFYNRFKSLCGVLENFQDDATAAVCLSSTCKRAYYRFSPYIKNTARQMIPNILKSPLIMNELFPMATDYYHSKHTEQTSPYTLYSLKRLEKYPIVLHYMGKILTEPIGFIEESNANYRRYLVHRNFAYLTRDITKCYQNILNQPVGPFGSGEYIEYKERMDPGLKLLKKIVQGAFNASKGERVLIETQYIDQVEKLNPRYTHILPFKLVKTDNDVYCEPKALQTENPYNSPEQLTIDSCSIV